MSTTQLQLHKLWLQQNKPQSIQIRTSGQAQRIAGMPESPLAHMPPATPALRVLRVHDQDVPADRAGRMVISGRMADVIAEINRLACP